MQQQIWKKFWPLEDTVMGLQEEMFFSKFQRACHTSLREQIHTNDFGFQFSMCVEESNLLFLVVFQHKDWLFLSIEYTRSDDSELSEDETGPDVKRFVTKRLAWEGLKLRALKDVLDLAHKRLLKPHVRNFQTERVVGKRFSSRGPPSVATSTPARGR